MTKLPNFPKFTAHTTEGVQQFDTLFEAMYASHHTTSDRLVSSCGAVVGLSMNWDTIVELNTVAGCPEPVNCAHDSVLEQSYLLKEFNEVISEGLLGQFND